MAIAGPFVDQECAQSNHVNSSINAFTAVKNMAQYPAKKEFPSLQPLQSQLPTPIKVNKLSSC